jgi:hypothetical protein
MYALVSLWQLPEAPYDEPQSPLDHRIVRFAQQAPGFVEGYWSYERVNGKSVGFILVDTAEHARALRDAMENRMDEDDHPSIRLEMIRVQEVMTHVSADGIAADDVRTGNQRGRER